MRNLLQTLTPVQRLMAATVAALPQPLIKQAAEISKNMDVIKRGALIVLEGCDKAGKSTHSKLLVEALQRLGISSHHMSFPNRTTTTGKVLDEYLRCQTNVSDEAIHLLFSANRWELVPQIEKRLTSGETVIVDRYAFSGVAFSVAKGSLSLEWCKNPDVGLPKPDKVLMLELSEEDASKRGDYGQERYETTEFQCRAKSVFKQLIDDSYWTVINTNDSKDTVHNKILEIALETIEKSKNLPLAKLWENV